MAEQNTLYKLIVLYMLQKIKFSMTYAQIADFLLEKGYTSYFVLQSALAELQEADMIHLETVRNTTYYTITPEGEETIGFFAGKIPQPIRTDIDEWLLANKLQIREEVSVLADYYRSTSGEYDVRCRVTEQQHNLIDLTISVPEESQARAICIQWKKKCQNVYAWIMNELMQESD